MGGVRVVEGVCPGSWMSTWGACWALTGQGGPHRGPSSPCCGERAGASEAAGEETSGGSGRQWPRRGSTLRPA